MSQYPVMLTGRLTQDPILTKTSTGAYKTKLRIASSRRVPDRPADTGTEAENQRGQQQWRDDEGKDHYRTFIKAQYVGLDLNRHVIGAKRLAPQYNQENIAIPELGDNEVEPDVDNSAPGDTAADTAADRIQAGNSVAAQDSEEVATQEEETAETVHA